MGMKYVATSKESGRKVQFGSKKAMDAALKAGTHTPPVKGKAKGGPVKGKSVFGTHSQRSAWDPYRDRVITFRTKKDRDLAVRSGRYDKISKAAGSSVDVSSVVTNGKKEREFYDTIDSWIQRTGKREADSLNKMRKYFNRGKETMPAVFKPSVKPGKPVFRGLSDLSKKTESWIKSTDWRDWKPVTDKSLATAIDRNMSEKWYVYTGKNRKQFTYRPHQRAQSWSSDVDVAFGFAGDALLVHPLDNSFYFSPKYMNRFGFGEDEVIRLGGSTKKPQLLVSADRIRQLKHNERR